MRAGFLERDRFGVVGRAPAVTSGAEALNEVVGMESWDRSAELEVCRPRYTYAVDAEGQRVRGGIGVGGRPGMLRRPAVARAGRAPPRERTLSGGERVVETRAKLRGLSRGAALHRIPPCFPAVILAVRVLGAMSLESEASAAVRARRDSLTAPFSTG